VARFVEWYRQYHKV